MTYPVYRLFMSGVCIVLALAMYWLFRHTRLGMRIRAGSTNREMVQNLGIDVSRLYRVVFAGGVALAVFAGMLAAPVSSVYPGMGNQVLIVCFVVVVIGGLGSLAGAFMAAMLLGHWYLNAPGMKISPLVRLTALMGATIAARALVSGLGLAGHLGLITSAGASSL